MLQKRILCRLFVLFAVEVEFFLTMHAQMHSPGLLVLRFKIAEIVPCSLVGHHLTALDFIHRLSANANQAGQERL